MATHPLQKKKMTNYKTNLTFILLLLSVFFGGKNVLATELNIYYSNDMHGKVEPCG